MNKKEINGMPLEELKVYMKEIGEQAFRGEQVFNFLHANKGKDINKANTLSKNLREKLLEKSKINKIDIYKKFESEIDNTKKYLFELEDRNIIESVSMEYKHGTSVCISTQIGCKMGCSFCASTKDGLIRNLTSAEMLNQVYEIERDLEHDVSNIVLMGSGEPLDNYEETLKFIDIITDEKGHNLSVRNITLSTCGVVPEIYKLAEEKLPITLAISLHSAFDENRQEIMPIAKKHSIQELMEACRYYVEKTGRRITFEYTLIQGVNDRKKDAEKLSKLFKGLNMHLNLIPLNPIKEYNKEVPSNRDVEEFKELLEKRNIRTTIRREMGQDISASCGQLRISVLENN